MLKKLRTADLGTVVVLNDFFLDRIISISDVGSFYSKIMEKINFGGSIRNISQRDLKGGNATNVAFALARLGCSVSLITIADGPGSAILKEAFSGFDNATLYVIDGKPGRTTALEFENGNNMVNIMFSDLGDNEDFGPEKLGSKERAALKKADAVVFTNWASNLKGTELAGFVFENSGKALHILDPADVQTRAKEFKEALGNFGGTLDSLCINENECNILLSQYGLGRMSGTEESRGLLMELSRNSSVPIDLHTAAGSYWTDGRELEFARSFPVKPCLVTGAGDVWDAANTMGYLAKLDPSERLLFANAAASLYVANPDGIPPTMEESLALVVQNEHRKKGNGRDRA
ncbi:MAG: carbohydrate kinase family protein [Thaumarchaeota archaeon]|nr:carbohydrate kinase family protein [Nitrososphaerota archaeon]